MFCSETFEWCSILRKDSHGEKDIPNELVCLHFVEFILIERLLVCLNSVFERKEEEIVDRTFHSRLLTTTMVSKGLFGAPDRVSRDTG